MSSHMDVKESVYSLEEMMIHVNVGQFIERWEAPRYIFSKQILMRWCDVPRLIEQNGEKFPKWFIAGLLCSEVCSTSLCLIDLRRMKSSKAVRLFCGGPEGVTSLPPPSRAPVPFGRLRRRSAGLGVWPACRLAPSAPSSMTHTAGMLRRRHVEKQPLCTPFTASSADAYDGKIPRKLAHGAAGRTCSVPRSNIPLPR
nr:uncharacterized protein LOC127303057 isoform X2 [Lolium perenne]